MNKVRSASLPRTTQKNTISINNVPFSHTNKKQMQIYILHESR